MKRLTLIAAVLAVGLAACGDKPAEKPADNKGETKASTTTTTSTTTATPATAAGKKIRIATEGAYAPFNFKNPDGSLSGFDVDVAKAICAQIKADCEMVAQDFDGLIPGLVAKKYDTNFEVNQLTSGVHFVKIYTSEGTIHKNFIKK